MTDCSTCERPFTPRQATQIYCGARCREDRRNRVRQERNRGDVEATVTCPSCGTDFDRFSGTTTRWRTFCSDDCRKVYYDGGFDKYELTPFEYNGRLAAQGGVCAICKEPETTMRNGKTVFRLAIDHDHNTGAVRGLLCLECNRGLGAFDDDPSKVERALEYLTRKAD